jgi:alginate O-acetyltransferase complex protein AlgI
MLFTIPLFLFLFQPLTTLLYWVSPLRRQNTNLLVVSMLFYWWGEPRFIVVVLASATLDFILGRRVARRCRDARACLVLGVVANLGLLFTFKYADFSMRSLQPILGNLLQLNLLLPLGISFIVFEKITYLADIYQGKSRPAASLHDYLLFVFLYPKMLAGPIIKYYEIEPFLRDRPVSWILAASGLQRFFWGLVKKVLIADVCGEVASAVFDMTPGTVGFGTAWLGVTAFTVQIYFDFSGYSDMAIGLARTFGFQLRENFDHPYGSASFTEFWRRWHISLSTWIRDYLYLPLGGNRRGIGRTYVNLWTCFLLSGLWHGAAWNFVFWGAWNGLFLMCDRLFWTRLTNYLPRFVSVSVTLLLVMIGWTIFRAPDLLHLASILRAMASPGHAGDFVRVQCDQIAAILIGFVGSLVAATGAGRTIAAAADESNSGRTAVSLAVVSLAVLAVSKAVAVTFSPFLYFRF